MTQDSQTIKYRYAFDVHDNVTDIKDADRKGSYKCIACGEILKPVMGQKRQWHFRHRSSVDCSLETYLHKLGKYLFKKIYESCLDTGNPFFVEIRKILICTRCKNYGPCQIEQSMVSVDITKDYREIYLECREGEFVPDLLLKGKDGSKLYIEIAVTHECSVDKIQSGNEIIEISVKSEDDLNPILSCLLSESTENVRFYNVKDLVLKDDFSDRCRMASHKELKLYFKKLYEESLANNEGFQIELNQPLVCNHCKEYGPCEILPKTSKLRYDLTAYYSKTVLDYCQTENYIPELFIESDTGNKIYIEFDLQFLPVDIRSAKEKEKSINIRVFREEDCKLLLSTKILSQDSEEINFMNFNPKKKYGNYSKMCNVMVHAFFVRHNGSAFQEERLANHEYERIKSKFLFVKLISFGSYDDAMKEIFIKNIEQCFIDGVNVKNCYICRYHAQTNKWQREESEKGGFNSQVQLGQILFC